MVKSKKLADLDLEVKEKELLAKMRAKQGMKLKEIAEVLELGEDAARIEMRNWERKKLVKVEYNNGKQVFFPGEKVEFSLSTKSSSKNTN